MWYFPFICLRLNLAKRGKSRKFLVDLDFEQLFFLTYAVFCVLQTLHCRSIIIFHLVFLQQIRIRKLIHLNSLVHNLLHSSWLAYEKNLHFWVHFYSRLPPLLWENNLWTGFLCSKEAILLPLRLFILFCWILMIPYKYTFTTERSTSLNVSPHKKISQYVLGIVSDSRLLHFSLLTSVCNQSLLP